MVRPIMIKYARIPQELQQSIAIPVFKPPSVPDKELFMDVYNWLNEKGILKSELTFREIVRGDLLP
jgi:hypothetical protein